MEQKSRTKKKDCKKSKCCKCKKSKNVIDCRNKHGKCNSNKVRTVTKVITVTKVTKIKKVTKVEKTQEPEALVAGSCVTGFVDAFAPDTWENVGGVLTPTFDSDLELELTFGSEGQFINRTIYPVGGTITFDWSRGPGSPTLIFTVNGVPTGTVPPTGGDAVIPIPASPDSNTPIVIGFTVIGSVGDEVTIDEFRFSATPAAACPILGFVGRFAPENWSGSDHLLPTFGPEVGDLKLISASSDLHSFSNTSAYPCSGQIIFRATTQGNTDVLLYFKIEGNEPVPITLDNRENVFQMSVSTAQKIHFEIVNFHPHSEPAAIIISEFRFVPDDCCCQENF